MKETGSHFVSSPDTPDYQTPKSGNNIPDNPKVLFSNTPENAPEIREPEKSAPSNLLLSPSDLTEEKQHELFVAIKYGFEDLIKYPGFTWNENVVGIPDNSGKIHPTFLGVVNKVAELFSTKFSNFEDLRDYLHAIGFTNGRSYADGSRNPVFSRKDKPTTIK